MLNLQNKVAVITGGGRGIGLGISHQLLAAGAQLLIAQRQPLPESLQSEKVQFVEADLSDPQAAQKIAAACQTRYGRCDILVNNAGIMFEQSLASMSIEQWDLMMAVNLRAPVFLAKALLGLLQASESASIINIGSIEGLAANPEHIAYCASKAGIHGATQAMASDLGPLGIRCNAIAPGWIESDLSRDYINSQPNPEQAHQGLVDMHPVGRTGQPSDIGDMVVFLASSQSAFICGQILTVDGGRTCKLPLPF